MTYTTADLVKAELRATTDFSSTTLPTLSQVTTWIGEDSAQIDLKAGDSFEQTTYTDVIDYDFADEITLKHAPIITVNSLLYSTAVLGTTGYGLTNTAVEDTDFTVYTDRGIIAPIFTKWSGLKEGRKMLSVNYDAGYATTPLTIQKLATKMVAKRVLDTLVENDINNKSNGKSISVGSISIVKAADFGVKQYQQLTNEITDLTNQITNGTGVYRWGH